MGLAQDLRAFPNGFAYIDAGTDSSVYRHVASNTAIHQYHRGYPRGLLQAYAALMREKARETAPPIFVDFLDTGERHLQLWYRVVPIVDTFFVGGTFFTASPFLSEPNLCSDHIDTTTFSPQEWHERKLLRSIVDFTLDGVIEHDLGLRAFPGDVNVKPQFEGDAVVLNITDLSGNIQSLFPNYFGFRPFV